MEYDKKVDSNRILCLLEPSDLFSFGTLVSIYYINPEGFEILIGLGEVINIQDDKKIQVLISDYYNPNREIIEKLSMNNATILKKILIKPNIPKDLRH